MLYAESGVREKIKPTQEYWEIEKKLSKKEKEFEEELKKIPELLNLYWKAREESYLLFAESEDTHFTEGFKFGLRMGLEISTID